MNGVRYKFHSIIVTYFISQSEALPPPPPPNLYTYNSIFSIVDAFIMNITAPFHLKYLYVFVKLVPSLNSCNKSHSMTMFQCLYIYSACT